MLNILNIIGGHVQLVPQGNHYIGLCPFHYEKKPSFIVNPTAQTFKCLGCGVTGNAQYFALKIGEAKNA
jgi:DNA primase